MTWVSFFRPSTFSIASRLSLSRRSSPRAPRAKDESARIRHETDPSQRQCMFTPPRFPKSEEYSPESQALQWERLRLVGDFRANPSPILREIRPRTNEEGCLRRISSYRVGKSGLEARSLMAYAVDICLTGVLNR